jgi:hypothetical protein
MHVFKVEDRPGDKYLQRNKDEANRRFMIYVKRNSSLRGYIIRSDDNPEVPFRAGIRLSSEEFAKQEQELGDPIRYTSVTLGFERIEGESAQPGHHDCLNSYSNNSLLNRLKNIQ